MSNSTNEQANQESSSTNQEEIVVLEVDHPPTSPSIPFPTTSPANTTIEPTAPQHKPAQAHTVPTTTTPIAPTLPIEETKPQAKSKRGGYRPGAGRPRAYQEERMLYYNVSLPPSLVEYISSIGAQWGDRDGNLSDGIRRLAQYHMDMERARSATTIRTGSTTSERVQHTTHTHADHDDRAIEEGKSKGATPSKKGRK